MCAASAPIADPGPGKPIRRRAKKHLDLLAITGANAQSAKRRLSCERDRPETRRRSGKIQPPLASGTGVIHQAACGSVIRGPPTSRSGSTRSSGPAGLPPLPAGTESSLPRIRAPEGSTLSRFGAVLSFRVRLLFDGGAHPESLRDDRTRLPGRFMTARDHMLDPFRNLLPLRSIHTRLARND